MKNYNVMLDLETMGTRSNAAITAIGACVFDPYGDGAESKFFTKVSLKTSMAAGLSVDASTIEWWLFQSMQAREQTFAPAGQVTLSEALRQFNMWLATTVAMDYQNLYVWGNGATFDNVVIRSAYAAFGWDVPWSFRNDRCYRTVINQLPEHKRPPLERTGTLHNALHDAVTQAVHLQKVLKILQPEEAALAAWAQEREQAFARRTEAAVG